MSKITGEQGPELDKGTPVEEVNSQSDVLKLQLKEETDPQARYGSKGQGS